MQRAACSGAGLTSAEQSHPNGGCEWEWAGTGTKWRGMQLQYSTSSERCMSGRRSPDNPRQRYEHAHGQRAHLWVPMCVRGECECACAWVHVLALVNMWARVHGKVKKNSANKAGASANASANASARASVSLVCCVLGGELLRRERWVAGTGTGTGIGTGCLRATGTLVREQRMAQHESASSFHCLRVGGQAGGWVDDAHTLPPKTIRYRACGHRWRRRSHTEHFVIEPSIVWPASGPQRLLALSHWQGLPGGGGRCL